MSDTPKASATTIDRPRLAPEAMPALYGRNDWIVARFIILVLLGIVGAFVLLAWAPHPLTYAAGFVAIAGLQHHLSIIHHEGMHYLLHTDRRWNDRISALIGYSIGFQMTYRQIHFRHHQRLGLPEDPDLANYAPFPNSTAFLLRDLLWNLSGLAAITQFLKQSASPATASADAETDTPRPRSELPAMALTQLAIFGALALTGHWWHYPVFWLLPLVTLTKSLAHFRNVVEHTVTRDVGDPELSHYRTVRCNWLERFLFAPMNFHFHAEHHLYPSIPYFNLPAAHKLLSQDPAYAKVVDVFPGYCRFLLTAVRSGRRPTA